MASGGILERHLQGDGGDRRVSEGDAFRRKSVAVCLWVGDFGKNSLFRGWLFLAVAGDFFRTASLFGGHSLTPGGLVDFQGFSEGPKRPLQAFGKSSKSAREGPSLSRTCMVSGILRPLASALKSFCGCQK